MSVKIGDTHVIAIYAPAGPRLRKSKDDFYNCDLPNSIEESVREEEEALKQQLGSIGKDIHELNQVCAAQDKEIENMKQTYGFRLRWSREQWGERWRQSSSAPSEAEAERTPASKEYKE